MTADWLCWKMVEEYCQDSLKLGNGPSRYSYEPTESSTAN